MMTCYKIDDLEKLSRIVYESVLYYSYDQYQLEVVIIKVCLKMLLSENQINEARNC